MYCNNCGAELREGVAFCEQCGKAINEENKPKNKLEIKKNRKPLIISIIAAVLLLTIGIVAVVNTGILNPVQHNLNLGYKYLEEGNYEEALIAFNKVLEIEPNNTKAIIGSADAYVGLEDYESAIELLNKHISNDNENKELHEKLINILIDTGNYSEAKKAIDDASKHGYDYNIDALDEKIKKNILAGGIVSTGYKKGYYVAETDSKVITIDEDGIKVRASDSDNEKTVLKGKYEENFVTDGKILYFYDSENLTLNKLNLSDSSVTKLTNVYNNVTLEEDFKDFLGDGSLIGYADDHLYFQEWYGPGDATDFVFDLNNNTYKKLETSVYSIGEMDTYKDKIYYNELRFDASATPLYEANADGSNEKVISKYVMNFDIVGNTLYYTEMEGNSYDVYSKTTIKAYDLTTKKTETVKEIPCSGWVFFSSFGYGHGKTSDDDPYGIHIIMPNGASINKKGFVSASGDNYIICQEQPVEGSITPLLRYNVVYQGKMSDIVVIPSQSQVLGYFGGKFYYTPYDNNTWDYGKVETIVPNFE